MALVRGVVHQVRHGNNACREVAPIMLLDTRPQEREKGDARVFDSLLSELQDRQRTFTKSEEVLAHVLHTPTSFL